MTISNRAVKLRRAVCVAVLAFAMSQAVLGAGGSQTVYAATTGSQGTVKTLTDLKKKFPDRKYWNHKTKAGHKHVNYSDQGSCNNPDGYTDTPCTSHTVEPAVGGYDCNTFDNAMQCKGFAFKCAYDMYGASARTRKVAATTAGLKAGDVLTYFNDKVNATYGHSVFVTSVSGQKASVVECNYSGRCMISWGRVIDLASLTKVNVYVAPYAIGSTSGSTTAPSAPQTPAAPAYSVSTAKSTYYTTESVSTKWTVAKGATRYRITVKNSSGRSVYSKYLTGKSKSIGKLSVGSYTVSMTPYNATKALGKAVSARFTVKKKAAEPVFTFTNWTKKTKIESKNATLGREITVKNASLSSVSSVGFVIYDSKYKTLASKTSKPVLSSDKKKLQSSYNMKSSFKLALKSKTKYYYRFTAKIGTKTYYSSLYSFKTK